MSYLGDTGGVMSGMLPAPHDSVRIEVGPAEPGQIYVRYEGSPDALLAAGAIDRLMVEAPSDAHGGRDARARPYVREALAAGQLRITRRFSSIKKAMDLPGIGGSSPLQVDTPIARKPTLRLIINRP
jgi:hypothetical protein